MSNKTIHRHIEMKWPEFKEFVKKTDYALLPVAALEQHGPHLPFGSDVYIANGIAERVAEKTGALLMETLCYTPSFSLRYFPGTIHVSDENLVRVILDIVESMYRHGIKTIYVLVGHVGAAAACKEAERKLLLNSEARIVNLVMAGMNEATSRIVDRCDLTFERQGKGDRHERKPGQKGVSTVGSGRRRRSIWRTVHSGRRHTAGQKPPHKPGVQKIESEGRQDLRGSPGQPLPES